MDSPTPSTPPPPYVRSSSAEPAALNSRLAPPLDYGDHHSQNQIIIPFVANTPPSRKRCPISPSPLHLGLQHPSPVSLQELLLLSPSPQRRPKARASVADENHDVSAAAGTPRKRTKARAAAAAAVGLTGCASPRNVRRARRRLEKEICREEREVTALVEDCGGRVRKRKQCRSKVVADKEKLSLVPVAPFSSPSPNAEKTTDNNGGSLDRLWEQLSELVMWKNVAKSTLWFGIGSMFFLSSCFPRDFNFSISAMSHLGLMFLGFAFFRDSVPHRQQLRSRMHFQLEEDDILRAARLVLPVANAALAKIQEIFSGDPFRTLKVAPVLLFGAKYGHLLTLWRLFATGFLLIFTIPKLYSCYSQKIQEKVENTSNRVQEVWKSYPRKKLIVASAATLFWNLFSVKTRIFAAFISMVMLRCHHQQLGAEKDKSKGQEEEQHEPMEV